MKTRLLCVLTALVLLFPAMALAEVFKDEVVYARLSPEGKAEAVYLVNSFETDEAADVTDYGDYADVQPLGEAGAFDYRDGKADIRLLPGRFNYQGTLKADALPWTFALAYRLDGKETEPASLSGASGRLEVTLTVAPNEAMKPYADSLTLQVTVTLDSEKCLNIKAEKATQAVAGGSRTLSYVILPGQPAEYRFSADVRDFSMQGVQAAGVRMEMDAEMYQRVAAQALAGSPLENAVSGMMGGFMQGLQGQKPRSFADDRNTVRSLQFVMVFGGVPAPEKPEQAPEEPQAQNVWERFLRLFGG